MAGSLAGPPLNCFGRTREVAALSGLLVLEEGPCATGAELRVDGGILAGAKAPPGVAELGTQRGIAMPTTLPTFRPFDYADLPELQAIRQAAFAPVFRSFRQIVGDPIAMHVFARADAEQAELLASVCEPGSGHDVIVAVVGDALAGFASYKADPLARLVEIGLNAVHPRFAGHGVGTRMYEHVLAGMKEAGMMAATVSTGGDPSHAAARRAYAKAGFKERLSSIHLYRAL